MITSTSNIKIKRLVILQKKRKVRDEEKVFIVEGIRMFKEVPEDALKEVYVSESFYKRSEQKQLVDEICKASSILPEVLSDHVFAYVSDTKHPQGILCVVTQRGMGHTIKGTPLLLVLDNLQDPGNMGTILRTAEAAGVNGVIMSKDCVDVYNPKVIRSTMGSIFRLPFWYAKDMEETILKMKKEGICVYAAHLDGTSAYDDMDYKKASAFLIGNEGNGLREEIAKLADTYIRIPMEGEVESLNAAIAATVLMFEASRQRRK